MIYLDNDTVETFAEFDLLDFLCEALEVEHSPGEIFCLRTARTRVARTIHDPAVRGRALGFMDRVGVPSEDRSIPQIFEIQRLGKMDAEAILYACCIGDPGTWVVTGDLNSIRTLALNAPANIFDALVGRVFSTEQCLLRIIELVGFETVESRWEDSPCNHRFFAPLVELDEVDVRDAIHRRLDGLHPRMKALIGWP